MKKLIIFDCDGTLVDSEIIASRVFPEVWAEMGVSMTADYFICNFVGTGSDAEIVKQTMARLPANAMEIADQKFDEELARSLQPVQGMLELLPQLTHQICVASNSSLNYLKEALTKTQIAEYFGDRVYSARSLAKPKPAPDVFLHPALDLGFEPYQCIVVEDSIPGIQAAKNAGMPVVGFMGGQHFNLVVKDRLLSANADHYCTSTSELKQLLL